MNFGDLFEYYTPVTNSLTIFVGSMRLISHQTPGASKKWQQPPNTAPILSFKKKIPTKIYPPHLYIQIKFDQPPPPKKTWVILNSNQLPIPWSFSQGIRPQTCWQRSPWSWQEWHSNLFAVSHPNSPHTPVGLGGFWNLSEANKKSC